jgi:subtilisin family serine protease
LKRIKNVKLACTIVFVLVLFFQFSFPVIVGYVGSERPVKVEASSHLVLPVIYHPDQIDSDFDGIEDGLEGMISRVVAINGAVLLPVVVTLYNPVESRDLEYFMMFGGRISYVYSYVTYGFAGSIPAVNISRFAEMEGSNLCIIEYDVPLEYHLEVSVPLIRARPIVWDTYGYMGSENYSIAIIDTGIDDTHPDIGSYGDRDFSKKIVGWYDATEDNALLPEDFGEHGSHVAGIAAGSGLSNSLQGLGNVTTTFTYFLPSSGLGYMDYIDILNPGVIKLNLSWNGRNDVLLRLYDPAENVVAQVSGKNPPLILVYNTSETAFPTGRYGVLVGNLAGPPDVPFSVVEIYPYQGLADGYNLFTGVAPNSKLVGVKVFDNTGSGTTSTVMAGMEWVIQNKMDYHITVASMSLGLRGSVDTTLDQKADTLVKNGIVTTVSAGNEYPDYTIGSPGTAAYVITVAATNDQNGITDYSSNGDSSKNEYGLIKPDVAAPGGTFHPEFGNRIVSVDSNDLDAMYGGFDDRNVNDYQQMAGTSMSAPHVAGLAALIIEAIGKSWNWTESEALMVKMIISMTAFETQNGEGTNIPPLDRGGKDNKEGYGCVNVDAAIEAVTMNYSIGDYVTGVFGAEPWAKKVWARQVILQAETRYRFELLVPEGADYDLFLYNGAPNSYGEPIVLSRSINAAPGADEVLEYTPNATNTYYLVAKWVSGSGEFSLKSSGMAEHDVAVLGVDPSVEKVYQGNNVSVNVTVGNEGLNAESFNVTVFYDGETIGIQQINLMAGETVILLFIWNTSGASYGNHTLSASAEAVFGEYDTVDNSFIDGTVYVKLPGDVNGDGIVDNYDLLRFSGAYGAKFSDFNWDEECDIDNNNIVDIYDLTLISENYGKST